MGYKESRSSGASVSKDRNDLTSVMRADRTIARTRHVQKHIPVRGGEKSIIIEVVLGRERQGQARTQILTRSNPSRRRASAIRSPLRGQKIDWSLIIPSTTSTSLFKDREWHKRKKHRHRIPSPSLHRRGLVATERFLKNGSFGQSPRKGLVRFSVCVASVANQPAISWLA